MRSDSTIPAFAQRLFEFMERRSAFLVDTEREFDVLARELFGLQFGAIPLYRSFCHGRGAVPGRIPHWAAIPAVPVRAFKEFDMSSLPEAARTRVFLSSGTTGEKRSRHFHNAESLRVYEGSLCAWFEACVLKDRSFGGEAPVTLSFVSLTPPGSEAPESSLVHMFETLRRTFEFPAAEFVGRSGEDGSWTVDIPRALKVLQHSIDAQEPVLLVGTAFSFVHLTDYLAALGESLRLAPGSQVMETGGYKGRSRVLERPVLHGLLGERLGIPQTHIVSEYGMCELSSQGYSRSSGLPTSDPPTEGRAAGAFRFPHWSRVQVISPEDGREVAEGETGLVRVFDLANVYSVMAVQTEDIAIRRGRGLELVGRALDSEPRGCSLMARELTTGQDLAHQPAA